jgi:hypothetical protein
MTNVAQLIDLGFDGVTPNDFNDSDLGPNGLQNTPIISSVLTDGSTQIRVTGSFTGAANKTLTVELYEHGTLSQSARSQFVGTLSITTDAFGNASFTQTFFGNYLAGTLFSATATDVTVPNNRSTSEHSAAIAASLSTVIVTPIAGLVVNESGSTANFSLSLSTAPTSDVVITLSTSIAGEISLSTNTITFTTQNWNIAQVVTITGLQDFVSDGTKSLFVITSQTTSSDPRYNGLTVSDVAVSNQEVANVAPTISAPLSYSITEDVPANLGGISTGLVISDVDAGSNLLSVTLSTSNGTFSLGSLAGITFLTGDGNADPVMIFQGTTSAINAAINTIAFIPTLNFFGTASFSITVNDLGNSGSGGALSATRVMPINVAPVNDAPVLLGTRTASVVEAGSVLISSTMLSLTDVDTTSSDLVFTIKAIDAEGEFMRSGVSLRAGDSFTQAEINSQLIQYVHFGGELPTATVTLGASERFGLALADFNLVFSVVAVNDAPTITGVSNAQVLEISNLGTPVATVSASDPDNASGLIFSLSNKISPNCFGEAKLNFSPAVS